MSREIAIRLYLLFFGFVFKIYNRRKLQNKVTFVISFGDNSRYIYDEIKRKHPEVEIVLLSKKPNNHFFSDLSDVSILPFETKDIFSTIRSIYHLATSKYVIVDNYFGFLAAVDFKEEVECIQIWHATGAIKTFGLRDLSIHSRSKAANKRFLEVYNRFDKIIVGSDEMAEIFKEAFQVDETRIIRTGIPRTDFFFQKEWHIPIIKRLEAENPKIREKKTILYAPTFRDNELDHFTLALDLKQMQTELSDEYIVLLRLHPAIKNDVNIAQQYEGFVYDYSGVKYDVNELLLVTDYLISDYSSIPYEFSILRKPMIFFAYDLDDYTATRGIWKTYEEIVPGPVVRQTEDVIKLIKQDQFDYNQIEQYDIQWNKYSRGQSSHNLVEYLFSKSNQ